MNNPSIPLLALFLLLSPWMILGCGEKKKVEEAKPVEVKVEDGKLTLPPALYFKSGESRPFSLTPKPENENPPPPDSGTK